MTKFKYHIAAATLSSLFVCGIAAAEVWTGYAHEGNEWRYCPSGQVARTLECYGGDCAQIDMFCVPPSLPLTTASYQAGPNSEEQGKFYCNPGYVVNGIDVDGWDNRGDDITMNCVQLQNAVQDDGNCAWSPWVSNEVVNSPPSDNSPFTAYDTHGDGTTVRCEDTIASSYIHGMECDGGWCDYMRLYCCKYEASAVITVPKWDQCGGNGGICGTYYSDCYQLNSPHDNAWPAVQCAPGSTCQRQHQWYWQCL